MASGNSLGRGGSGSRSFVDGSDDVFLSYDDPSNNPNGFNRNRSMSSVKDFQEMRAGSSCDRPFPNIYSQQDEYNKHDMVSSIDKCMKKYVDNLLGFHEGISVRLSKLEAQCYSLEKSLGELQSDLCIGHRKSHSKLMSLEKHFQELHRSVQILRDKQELADTQKELTKLQLAQKDSSDQLATSVSEYKNRSANQKTETSIGAFIPQQSSPLQTSTVHSEVQYIQQRPQTHEVQYHQQLPQQSPSQQPPQHIVQKHNQSPLVYSFYQSFPSSAPMPNATIPSKDIRKESAAFAYDQHPPTVINMQRPTSTPALQAFPRPKLSVVDGTGGYMNLAPYTSQQYNMSYENDGSRAAHFSPAIQSQHEPSNPGANLVVPLQHPHGEMIEKCAAMGYTRGSIISAINKMQESGLAVNFNSLLGTINLGFLPSQKHQGWATGGW